MRIRYKRSSAPLTCSLASTSDLLCHLRTGDRAAPSWTSALVAKPHHLCQTGFSNFTFLVLGLIFNFQSVIFFFFLYLAFSLLHSSWAISQSGRVCVLDCCLVWRSRGKVDVCLWGNQHPCAVWGPLMIRSIRIRPPILALMSTELWWETRKRSWKGQNLEASFGGFLS